MIWGSTSRLESQEVWDQCILEYLDQPRRIDSWYIYEVVRISWISLHESNDANQIGSLSGRLWRPFVTREWRVSALQNLTTYPLVKGLEG